MIEFFIPGVPIPKGRARATRSGHHYTPRRTKEYETLVAWYGKTNCKTPMQGPLKAELIFTMPIPSSLSKTRQVALIGQPHILKTGDITNITKAIEDGLNGIAYFDDSQIAELHARKVYGEIPGVSVKISSITAFTV